MSSFEFVASDTLIRVLNVVSVYNNTHIVYYVYSGQYDVNEIEIIGNFATPKGIAKEFCKKSYKSFQFMVNS